jgi:Ca-activated chloride channel family protein
VLVGRYRGAGPSAAVIEGTVNGTKTKFSYDVKFAGEPTEHDFIPRLWATRRVGYLLEEIRLHGENAELKDEVTELARQYSIVTPYTAYLIVEDEAHRGVPLLSQTMPQLQQDTAARDASGQYYNRLMMERYGLGPVTRSRSEQALKSATTADGAVTLGNKESLDGFAGTASGAPSAGGPTPSASSPIGTGPGARVQVAGSSFDKRSEVGRVAQYTQQARFVGGRSFYQNGNQWIDATIQKLKNAKRVRVQLDSKEYFELLAKKPETAPWLALGQNVQFALNDIIYEIFDQDTATGARP